MYALTEEGKKLVTNFVANFCGRVSMEPFFEIAEENASKNKGWGSVEIPASWSSTHRPEIVSLPRCLFREVTTA